MIHSYRKFSGQSLLEYAIVSTLLVVLAIPLVTSLGQITQDNLSSVSTDSTPLNDLTGLLQKPVPRQQTAAGFIYTVNPDTGELVLLKNNESTNNLNKNTTSVDGITALKDVSNRLLALSQTDLTYQGKPLTASQRQAVQQLAEQFYAIAEKEQNYEKQADQVTSSQAMQNFMANRSGTKNDGPYRQVLDQYIQLRNLLNRNRKFIANVPELRELAGLGTTIALQNYVRSDGLSRHLKASVKFLNRKAKSNIDKVAQKLSPPKEFILGGVALDADYEDTSNIADTLDQ